MLGAIIKWLKGVVDALDLVATLVGGWPILGGMVFGAITATWSAVVDLGPFTVIIALYAVALGAIVTDLIGFILHRSRQTSKAVVMKARKLHVLATEASAISAKFSVNALRTLEEQIAHAQAILDWRERALRELETVGFFDEYYGFESLSFNDQRNKLRRIIMRYAHQNKILTEDVLRST